jgi:hypothetical protein
LKDDISHMETIDKHFRKLTAPVFQKHGFAQVELLAHWPDIVGAQIAKIAIPEKIRWPHGKEEKSGGTLHLKVQAGRGLDVQYATHTIMERVNRFLGYQGVASLKILQTHEPMRAAKAKPRAIEPPPRILAQVETIEDPDLQLALARLGAGISGAQQRSPQAK